MLKKTPKSVHKAYADGAYDTSSCRKALEERGIENIIPPRKTGVVSDKEGFSRRNDFLREIKGLDGDLDLWKKLHGYGRRSLAETFFSRLKTIYPEKLRSKKFAHQEIETLLKISTLNKMAVK